MVRPPANVDVADAPDATRLPPLMVPVVVMFDAPLLIVPKFEVIDPESRAPTVVTLDSVVKFVFDAARVSAPSFASVASPEITAYVPESAPLPMNISVSAIPVIVVSSAFVSIPTQLPFTEKQPAARLIPPVL